MDGRECWHSPKKKSLTKLLCFVSGLQSRNWSARQVSSVCGLSIEPNLTQPSQAMSQLTSPYDISLSRLHVGSIVYAHESIAMHLWPCLGRVLDIIDNRA
jgi:hypothetical protein